MSETESALAHAKQLLAQWAAETREPETNRLDVILTRENLRAAVQTLTDARWGYLAALTGLDLFNPLPKKGEPLNDAFEILYHFCAGAAVLTLRVTIPRADAFVPTVCDMIPAASPFERELIEMFGVQVSGTPDASRLYLPEDWEAGVYPLRKDFVLTESER